MNRIAVGPEGEFSLGGKNFVIDMSAKSRRQSTAEAFTIVKHEPYLSVYENLASDFSPRSILELGFSRAGVTCFWTSYLSPGECPLWK